MTQPAAEAFRAKINTSEELQDAIRAQIQAGNLDLVALGATHGFEFSAAEANTLVEQLEGEGELSEFELEVVSGGSGSTGQGPPTGDS